MNNSCEADVESVWDKVYQTCKREEMSYFFMLIIFLSKKKLCRGCGKIHLVVRSYN